MSRERVFRKLDDSDARTIWITAPAGSGKTALASSWVQARGLTCLWFQLDAGDADPATFFHYLILAGLHRAGRKRVHFTALTPEYLPGIELYARRFFEQLLRLYSEPFVLVFDNCHELATIAPLAGLILNALIDSMPAAGKLVCLSRGPMPSGLTRQSAGPGFLHLDWEELSFTTDEAIALAERIAPAALRSVEACNQWVRGWAAGLKLLLRAPPKALESALMRGDLAEESLFNYLSEEVLQRAFAEQREFLLRSAVLEEMEPEIVAAVTGLVTADAMLVRLHEERLFVERRQLQAGLSYRFHPLFRNFLRHRALQTFARDEWARLSARAAAVLEERGQFEAATLLALDLGDDQRLARLVLRQASALMEQGRLATLERWLGTIDEAVRNNNGWLLYWLGIASSVKDPAAGCRHLEQAHGRFQATSDQAGAWLALAGLVYGNMLAWDSTAVAPARWIEEMERLRAANGGAIPSVVELPVLEQLLGWVNHYPESPLSRHVVERAHWHLGRTLDPQQRWRIAGIAIGFAVWQGDEAAANALIEQLKVIGDKQTPVTLARLICEAWRGIFHWTRSEHGSAVEVLSASRAQCREVGLGIFEHQFLVQLILTAMSAGQSDEAARLISIIWATFQPFQVALLQMTRAMEAMHHALAGRAVPATRLTQELLRSDSFRDAPTSAAFHHCMIAIALLETGALEEAESCASGALERAGRLPSDRWTFDTTMVLAGVALARGAVDQSLDWLREALRVGASRDFGGGISLFQAVRTAQLLALALRHGIEVDYVRRLIRRRRLMAPKDFESSEVWPVRLRIRTLGQFSVLIDDQPVHTTNQAARKPLEVLKALAGLGTADISLAHLGESLWPELDGAAAHNACHVAIHRLRKILGDESAIRIDHGTVALNWADAWADVEAFRHLASHVRAALAGGLRSQPEIEGLAGQLLEAYAGHFLPGEDRPWVIGVREQLRARFVDLAIEVSAALERAGAVEAAIALNRHGIELDPLAEAFHRGLIRGLIALRRKAEALEAFRHCRATLLAGLRVEPSAETYELHSRIRQL